MIGRIDATFPAIKLEPMDSPPTSLTISILVPSLQETPASKQPHVATPNGYGFDAVADRAFKIDCTQQMPAP